MRFTRLFLLVMLLVAPAAHAVVINGLDWRQVTETTNISWNQMAANCDLGTGVCSGSIGSVSVDGWTWAGIDEVRDLFATVTGQPASTFGTTADPAAFYAEAQSTWAPAMLDIDGAGPDAGYFAPTLVQISHSGPGDDRWGVYGFTRELLPDGRANRTYIKDTLTFGDQAISGNPVLVDAARATNGFWMYQTTSVPTAPSAILLLAGLLLGVTARRSRTGTGR